MAALERFVEATATIFEIHSPGGRDVYDQGGWHDFEWTLGMMIGAAFKTTIAARQAAGSGDTAGLEGMLAEHQTFTRLVCDLIRERARARRRATSKLRVVDETQAEAEAQWRYSGADSKGVGRVTVRDIRERVAELREEYPLVPEGVIDFKARQSSG